MRVLFALVAWGNDYVRDFLDVSLPSLMAEGNLADSELQFGSRLLILTSREDIAAFEADPGLSALKRKLPIEYVDISRFRIRDKYGFASRCQVEALRRSEGYDAIFPLYPDMIWCRGGLSYAVQRLEEGALAVFAPAPAVLPEPTLAALQNEATMGDDSHRIISISSSKLAGIALRHHHPMWDAFDWDGRCFTEYPACLRWNVANQKGWLIRCFHLHPVALRVQRDNPRFFARFTTSIDGEYVACLFDGTDGLALATDTDFFALVTLRDGKMAPLPVQGNGSSVTKVARWAERDAFLLHRAFSNVAFRWHEEPVSEESWRHVERRSSAILAEVRDRLHTPDSIIRVEDPQSYRARHRRSRSSAFGDTVDFDFPSSHANEPRRDLAVTLIKRMAFGAALGAKVVLEQGPLGRWLRQQSVAVALWQRTKITFAPKSSMHAATTTTNLIRNMLSRKH